MKISICTTQQKTVKHTRVEDIFPQLSIILVIFNGGLKPDLDSTKIHSF